jgi:hypothetical protein
MGRGMTGAASIGGVAARTPGSGSVTSTFSGLQRHSASSYSVDTSVGQISAVAYGDSGSLSQTGAVM